MNVVFSFIASMRLWRPFLPEGLVKLNSCLKFDNPAESLSSVRREMTSRAVEMKELNECLFNASRLGLLNVVREMLPVSEVDCKDSLALALAAENGHLGVVKVLLPFSDPKANNSQALQKAAQRGHADVVKFLLPVSDPKTDNSMALRWAAQNGHKECIKLLAKVSDAKVLGSNALYLVAKAGDLDSMRVLCPLSDTKAVLKTMNVKGDETAPLISVIEELALKKRHLGRGKRVQAPVRRGL